MLFLMAFQVLSEESLLEDIKEAYIEEDYETCEKLCRKFLKRFPDSVEIPTVELAYGVSLYRLGKTKKAMEILEDVVDNFPDFSKMDAALYVLALCYEEEGYIADAEDCYKQIIEEFEDSKYAQKAEERLEALQEGEEEEAEEEEAASGYSFNKFTYAKGLCALFLCVSLAAGAWGVSDYLRAEKYYDMMEDAIYPEDVAFYREKGAKLTREAQILSYLSAGSFVVSAIFFGIDYFWVGRVEELSMGVSPNGIFLVCLSF